MAELLAIDGSGTEDGSAFVRGAVMLAAAAGRSIRIDAIKSAAAPGLAADALALVRAVGQVCGAHLVGDSVGSRTLTFIPRTRPRAADYALESGANATALMLLTVALPLAFGEGSSALRIRGGTHVRPGPSADYAIEVVLPALAAQGAPITASVKQWGFATKSDGLMLAAVEGAAQPRFKPLTATKRGAFKRLTGHAAAAGMPAHIPQRLADRAKSGLKPISPRAAIATESVRAGSPGASLFLAIDYDGSRAGGWALGRPDQASEAVADEAVAAIIAHHRGSAAIDRALAEFLLPYLAFASGASAFTTGAASAGLKAMAMAVEALGVAKVALAPASDGAIDVRVTPGA